MFLRRVEGSWNRKRLHSSIGSCLCSVLFHPPRSPKCSYRKAKKGPLQERWAELRSQRREMEMFFAMSKSDHVRFASARCQCRFTALFLSLRLYHCGTIIQKRTKSLKGN